MDRIAALIYLFHGMDTGLPGQSRFCPCEGAGRAAKPVLEMRFFCCIILAADEKHLLQTGYHAFPAVSMSGSAGGFKQRTHQPVWFSRSSPRITRIIPYKSGVPLAERFQAPETEHRLHCIFGQNEKKDGQNNKMDGLR